MVKNAKRVICISILVLMLAIPALAQNTKGDKPTSNRESRFKKSSKKEKPAKRIRSGRRTTTSLRAYRPRKKSKGGERAGRALSPVFKSQPSEKPRNVFPQSGPYVNNKSKSSQHSERRSSIRAPKRVVARTSAGRIRNVYAQSNRFVNYSSSSDKSPGKKRRVIPRSASRSFIARRSLNNWANFPRPKPKREQAYTKDISGRRLRTKNFETKKPGIISVPGGRANTVTGKVRNIYPGSARFSRPSVQAKNVYPQKGPYVSNPSRKPKKIQVVSNRSTLARLNRLQGGPDKKPGKKRKVIPRSASGAFIARKSTNIWAHFPRPKHKGERAFTNDLSGHPLRTKNFETKRPEIIPSVSPYYGRKRVGDRPYRGQAGRYSTATRPGKAWLGDITKRNVRGRNYTSKIGIEGKPVLAPLKKQPFGERTGRKLRGSGFKTRSKPGEKRTGKLPVPVRLPGIGAKGVEKYQGNVKGGKGYSPQGEGYTGRIKTKRPLKGGGSISGRIWNNQGRALPPRTPGIGATQIDKYKGDRKDKRGLSDQGEEYTGGIKARRPAKGGGTRSGKLWNNKGIPVQARAPGIGAKDVDSYKGNIKGGKGFNPQGEGYTGNIKAGKPLKGGGSISGKFWNNQGRAVPPRVPGIGADRIEKYQGDIKGKKGFSPQGETYSGDIKGGKGFSPQGEDYSGSIKARRPLKGGGSVSGKLWNNKEVPVPGKTPGIGAKDIGTYRGGLKGQKGFNPQGETYSGGIKARRPLKGGGSVSGKLWNNKENPIPTRVIPNEAAKVGGFPGKMKRFSLEPGFRNQGEEFTGTIKASRPLKGGGSVSGKLWNNKETAVPVKTPREDQGGEFSGSIKFKRAAKGGGSVSGKTWNNKETPIQVKISGHYQGEESVASIKSRGYVKNQNAADEALKKLRLAGKASARSGDFQGNIKMHKFELFAKRELHPDAKFIKTNKNNVAEEKDLLTNFKLWWARLFKKNDTQPDHLKEKKRRPRYDKGEQGLWYD